MRVQTEAREEGREKCFEIKKEQETVKRMEI